MGILERHQAWLQAVLGKKIQTRVSLRPIADDVEQLAAPQILTEAELLSSQAPQSSDAEALEGTPEWYSAPPELVPERRPWQPTPPAVRPNPPVDVQPQPQAVPEFAPRAAPLRSPAERPPRRPSAATDGIEGRANAQAESEDPSGVLLASPPPFDYSPKAWLARLEKQAQGEAAEAQRKASSPTPTDRPAVANLPIDEALLPPEPDVADNSPAAWLQRLRREAKKETLRAASGQRRGDTPPMAGRVQPIPAPETAPTRSVRIRPSILPPSLVGRNQIGEDLPGHGGPKFAAASASEYASYPQGPVVPSLPLSSSLRGRSERSLARSGGSAIFQGSPPSRPMRENLDRRPNSPNELSQGIGRAGDSVMVPPGPYGDREQDPNRVAVVLSPETQIFLERSLGVGSDRLVILRERDQALRVQATDVVERPAGLAEPQDMSAANSLTELATGKARVEQAEGWRKVAVPPAVVEHLGTQGVLAHELTFWVREELDGGLSSPQELRQGIDRTRDKGAVPPRAYLTAPAISASQPISPQSITPLPLANLQSDREGYPDGADAALSRRTHSLLEPNPGVGPERSVDAVKTRDGSGELGDPVASGAVTVPASWGGPDVQAPDTIEPGASLAAHPAAETAAPAEGWRQIPLPPALVEHLLNQGIQAHELSFWVPESSDHEQNKSREISQGVDSPLDQIQGMDSPLDQLVVLRQEGPRFVQADPDGTLVAPSPEALSRLARGFGVDAGQLAIFRGPGPTRLARNIPHEISPGVDRPLDQSRGMDSPLDQSQEVDSPLDQSRGMDSPFERLVGLRHEDPRPIHADPDWMPVALPPQTLSLLARSLGVDAGQLAIFRGPGPTRLAQVAGADALTIGRTVMLSDSAISKPDLPSLVAHEAVHVLRDQDPRYVPPVLGGRRVLDDEESIARATETAISQQVDPGGPPVATWQKQWGNLPAPWQPMRLDAAESTTVPSAADLPSAHLAPKDRSLPPSSDSGASNSAPNPAQPSPDLDRIAKDVYHVLRARLLDDLRRGELK